MEKAILNRVKKCKGINYYLLLDHLMQIIQEDKEIRVTVGQGKCFKVQFQVTACTATTTKMEHSDNKD